MTAIMELDDFGNTRQMGEAPLEPTMQVGAQTRSLDDLSALDVELDQAAARENELRHARDLREARAGLVALFHELPPAAHRYVTEAAPARCRSRKSWPLEDVEACYAKLVTYDASQDDAELAELRSRADEHKRRLDLAREALVMSNLYIVPHIVKRFRRGSIPFVDLVQEGHVGLIKAVDRFDPDRGYRFSTYAYWWIRRSLSDAFTNRSRLIRLPDSLREDLRSLRRATVQLEEELGRRPTTNELARGMEIPEKKVKKLIAVVPDPSSIEELAQGYDEGWGAVIGEDEGPDPLERALGEELRRDTNQALERLEPREREVIRLRFGFDQGDGLTLAEIGKQIGLSRERVRQIERGALMKLHAWASTHRVSVC